MGAKVHANTQKDKKDDKWLEETWNTYSPQIYNLCRTRCENKEDAKDIYQNVALRFCQSAQKIVYDESVFPWLMQVFRNCFYDHVRFRQKQSPFSMVADVVGDYMALPAERSIFYRPGNQRNDELKRALDSLSRRDKELIDLTFHKGLTSEELSVLYGVSVNTIVKRRHSAIKRTRNVLLG